MPRNRFFKYRIYHVLLWMIVFLVWFTLRRGDYSSTRMALVVTTIKVTELALMIYITNYFLIPRLLYKGHYFVFTIAFVAIVFFSSILKMNVLGHLLRKDYLIHWARDLRSSLYDNILPHFFLVIAGAAAKLIADYGKLQQRMAEIAQQKAEAELNFLKSQINPHFVFNSLNSIYFLIHKENAEARNALHKFSDMLRYQLYEVDDDRIPIEKEINYLKDYVDLQQLRKDVNYHVHFNAAPDVRGFSLEPLLLVPFVENAFKHISHFNERSNYVKIDMLMVGRNFIFSVVNSREEQVVTEKPGGIGLANVRRRLELLYPNRHALKILATEEEYVVQLTIEPV